MSKKSRIHKKIVELQYNVRSIFVQDDFFENPSQTQMIFKGMIMFTFVNPLYSPYIFENFRPEQNYCGLYVVTLRFFNGFLIFWTFFYVDFPCGAAGAGQITPFCTQK